jgi:hypothetical protein
VILERSMNDQFLSNTYLVADEQSRAAIMIDAGGPVASLLDAIEREGLELTTTTSRSWARSWSAIPTSRCSRTRSSAKPSRA